MDTHANTTGESTSDTKLIAFIPARAGSKRLPNKNRMLLSPANLTLVQWTVLQAEMTRLFDMIVVSTDCAEIKQDTDELRYIPALHIHDRKPEHATDDATTQSVINDFLVGFPPARTHKFRVVLFQPTSPFRRLAVLHSLIRHDGFAFTGKRIKNLQVIDRYITSSLGRSRAPGVRHSCLAPSGNLYVWNVAPGCKLPDEPRPNMLLKSSPLQEIDIDTKEDLEIAQALVRTREQCRYLDQQGYLIPYAARTR